MFKNTTIYNDIDKKLCFKSTAKNNLFKIKKLNNFLKKIYKCLLHIQVQNVFKGFTLFVIKLNKTYYCRLTLIL